MNHQIEQKPWGNQCSVCGEHFGRVAYSTAMDEECIPPAAVQHSAIAVPTVEHLLEYLHYQYPATRGDSQLHDLCAVTLPELDQELRELRADLEWRKTSNALTVFKDGNQWFAAGPMFRNLQESLAWYGNTPQDAINRALSLPVEACPSADIVKSAGILVTAAKKFMEHSICGYNHVECDMKAAVARAADSLGMSEADPC
jgi:hypothetical protein